MTHLMPWFVGGPYAEAPAAVARMLGFAAASGREGIFGPTDCVVTALPTPGGAILAQPGGYAVRAYTQPYQSYLGAITIADQVSVDPTGSSGGRSDLVVIRVENPNVSGEPWQPPLDQTNGPYAYTRVIKNVPSGTTSFRQLGTLDSAFALARIDIPPNTATITQAMIKDLRGSQGGSDNNSAQAPVATAPTPQSWTFADYIIGADPTQVLPPPAGGATYTNWVSYPPQVHWSVPIPATATHATFFLQQSVYFTASCWGQIRLNVGAGQIITAPNEYLDELPAVAQGGGRVVYNTYGMRETVFTGGSFTIPAAMRGKTWTAQAEARSYDSTAHYYQGQVLFGNSCQAYLNIVFKQDAVLS